MRSRSAIARRLSVVLLALLSLPACIVFISSAPGSVTNANIIFIAVTEDGGLVAKLHVTVVSTDGGWRQEGVTGADGALRMSVGPGVSRVRASVTVPPGYKATDPERWPREIDLTGGDMEVQVRVRPEA